MTADWLRTVGWWAADYSYVLYWRARGLLNRIDSETLREGARAPVVVIPGIYEPWRFLLPLITQLRELGHPVFVVPSLKWNLRPVFEAAEVVSEFLERNHLHRVVIVAHSKGGLIGKQVMIRPDAGERVAGMVAVATPFAGSIYARYMLAPSLRIFSPKDATIRSLASHEGVNARIVSILGKFDPHIPARSALEGAKNVELETGGHFRILAHPLILAEIESLAG